MPQTHATRNQSSRRTDQRTSPPTGGPEDRYVADNSRTHPLAANIQSPSDAELLDILGRAMRGDPHSASGRNGAKAALDEQAPFASLIRGILQGELPAAAARTAASEFDIADVELEWEPVEASHSESEASYSPAQLPSPIAASIDVDARPPPSRRWAFGLKSIAFVVAISIAGASIPAWLAGPARYVAETRLQLQGEAISEPGLLGAIAARLTSPHLLSQVVAKLKLDRDPEFTGGKATAAGVVFDLFAGGGGASDAPSRAQAKLRDSLLVSADSGTGALRLSVVTSDASKSARIANRLADVAVYDAAITQSSTTSGSGTAALDAGSKAYDQAVAALAAFKAEVGEDKITAAVELQQQRKDLDAEVAAAANSVQASGIRVTAARSAKLADVLDGSLSPDLGSPAGLEDLRNRYAAAKSTLSQLSAQLGPRHPRLLAQQATVDDLRTGIQAELQRLVASSDADLKLALNDQKSLADKAVTLGRKAIGVDMVRLNQLQNDIETSRSGYEAAMQSIGNAKPSAAPVPLALALPAVAPVLPLDDNLAAAEMTGFLMGLGLAICLVFLRAWLSDALLSEGQVATGIATTEPAQFHRNEPFIEHDRLAIPPPTPRFDVSTPVANDWPQRDLDQAFVAPIVDEHLAALQDGMASLRAKVETYALQRRAALR